MNESCVNISVIVAALNAQSTIQDCIDSFIQQDYVNKELIIIDGGSMDGTVEILKENSADISFWLSEADKGIYNAWNKGLKHTRGEWIFFLGADDSFYNGQVLSKIATELEKVPDSVRVTYGQVNYNAVNGHYLYTQGEPWNISGKRFRQLMSIPHQGVFHRRSLFSKHGNFDENYKIAGDYELLLRELKNNEAVFLPIIVAVMVQGGLSNETENSLLIIKEVRRAQKKNGIKLPGIYWMMALMRVYIRIVIWRLLGEQNARKLLDFGRVIMGRPPHWTKNA